MRLLSTLILFVTAVMLIPLTTVAQQRSASVVVDVADKREIRDTQPVIGQLVATRRSRIATRIAGIIATVNFEVGDRVAEGHELVTLDPSRIEIDQRAARASIKVAQAELKVAEAKLKLAEQAFERQAALRRSTAFSRSRHDDLKQTAVQARSEMAKADAQIESARSNLARADFESQHTHIIAPFTGVVIARDAQPGQYVQPGGTVGSLLDIDNLEIEADVPGNIANGLHVGVTISAIFENGLREDAEVRTIVPVQNVSTRTRPVRFRVKLADLQESHIAIGSPVTMQMPVSAPRTVVTAPKDALLQGRGGWIVYVVSDGKAMPRTVKLGIAVEDRVEIVSGLEAGELVVVRGNERLRPGQPVRPRQVGKRQAAKQG
ncbi:MAG: efflux RND transporter periplasmic adaptor subunit [Hyphomicrobiaceae bacterium]